MVTALLLITKNNSGLDTRLGYFIKTCLFIKEADFDNILSIIIQKYSGGYTYPLSID